MLTGRHPSVLAALSCGCVQVRQVGDLLGRDRVMVATVAFGPPGEDYGVLQAMARALPRSTFQVWVYVGVYILPDSCP